MFGYTTETVNVSGLLHNADNKLFSSPIIYTHCSLNLKCCCRNS